MILEKAWKDNTSRRVTVSMSWQEFARLHMCVSHYLSGRDGHSAEKAMLAKMTTAFLRAEKKFENIREMKEIKDRNDKEVARVGIS